MVAGRVCALLCVGLVLVSCVPRGCALVASAEVVDRDLKAVTSGTAAVHSNQWGWLLCSHSQLIHEQHIFSILSLIFQC